MAAPVMAVAAPSACTLGPRCTPAASFKHSPHATFLTASSLIKEAFQKRLDKPPPGRGVSAHTHTHTLNICFFAACLVNRWWLLLPLSLIGADTDSLRTAGERADRAGPGERLGGVGPLQMWEVPRWVHAPSPGWRSADV